MYLIVQIKSLKTYILFIKVLLYAPLFCNRCLVKALVTPTLKIQEKKSFTDYKTLLCASVVGPSVHLVLVPVFLLIYYIFSFFSFFVIFYFDLFNFLFHLFVNIPAIFQFNLFLCPLPGCCLYNFFVPCDF